MGKPAIYGLHNGDGFIRYVGQAKNPGKRLKGYRQCGKKHGTLLLMWLLQTSPNIEMKIIQRYSQDVLSAAEEFWISHYRDAGNCLLNYADGGTESPSNHAVDRLNKLREIAETWDRSDRKFPHERQFLESMVISTGIEAEKVRGPWKRLYAYSAGVRHLHNGSRTVCGSTAKGVKKKDESVAECATCKRLWEASKGWKHIDLR